MGQWLAAPRDMPIDGGMPGEVQGAHPTPPVGVCSRCGYPLRTRADTVMFTAFLALPRVHHAFRARLGVRGQPTAMMVVSVARLPLFVAVNRLNVAIDVGFIGCGLLAFIAALASGDAAALVTGFAGLFAFGLVGAFAGGSGWLMLSHLYLIRSQLPAW